MPTQVAWAGTQTTCLKDEGCSAQEDRLVGACLPGFAQHRQNRLGEYRLSRILWSAVLLKWECHQSPLKRTPIKFSTRNRKQDLQEAVDSLLEKEPLHGCLQQVVSCSKEDRRFLSCDRPFQLNRHLVIPHFQMETAQTVRAAVRQDEWTVSIDIKDVYLHVPMSQSVRKFLRFCVNKKTSQFTCLPFGLATSPRVHQTPASCGAVTEVTMGPSSCVSRRLVDQGGLATVGIISCAVSHQSTAASGLDYKFREVRTHANLSSRCISRRRILQ